VKVLLATKVDLIDQRLITTEEGQDLAKINGMGYFEVSVKTGLNIDEAFKYAAREALKHMPSTQSVLPSTCDASANLRRI